MKEDLKLQELRMNRDQLITIGDLEQFKQELFYELSKYFQEKGPHASSEWLKSSDVRRLLKISAGTLQNLRINGQLPFKKIGGTMYYHSKDVDALLKAD